MWIGSDLSKADINIQVEDDMKVLGLWIRGKDCCESNWSKNEGEGKEEVWKLENKNPDHEAGVRIVQSHTVSRLRSYQLCAPPQKSIMTE